MAASPAEVDEGPPLPPAAAAAEPAFFIAEKWLVVNGLTSLLIHPPGIFGMCTVGGMT